MNIKDHWITKKGLPLKFDIDHNSEAVVKLITGNYWYGISSSDRAKWNLIPDIFKALLSTEKECDVALKGMIDSRNTEGKNNLEFEINDFYLRISPSLVQMEHAIKAGCEIEMEWKLFELALLSWKEFLGKVKRET